ncbi:hypothetical protein CISIN_1g017898mg [Citrus sinensis]|uniref:Uncharacterized protein n=1 Tax=Citrus sinensis TaxID=2711 RepID=A0A067H9T4_CITSI|nr:hypothetical protein CISIN_1g017898mg [Citrus sinensis]
MKMEVQSVCRGLQLPKFKSSNCGFLSHQFVSPSASQFGSRSQSIRFGNAYKFLGNTFPNLKHKIEGYSAWSSKRGAILCASNSGSDTKLGFPSGENSSLPVAIFNGPEPFRGKSGSVSFCGLTHQLVEEGKLMSAPFQEDKGSFLWILAPVVLISSLILPQMFLGNVIEDFIKDNLLMEAIFTIQPKEVGSYHRAQGILDFCFLHDGLKGCCPSLCRLCNLACASTASLGCSASISGWLCGSTCI